MPSHHVEVEQLCSLIESRLTRIITSSQFYGERATAKLFESITRVTREDLGSPEVSDQIPWWATQVLRDLEVHYNNDTRSVVLYSGNLPLHEALTLQFNQEIQGVSA